MARQSGMGEMANGVYDDDCSLCECSPVLMCPRIGRASSRIRLMMPLAHGPGHIALSRSHNPLAGSRTSTRPSSSFMPLRPCRSGAGCELRFQATRQGTSGVLRSSARPPAPTTNGSGSLTSTRQRAGGRTRRCARGLPDDEATLSAISPGPWTLTWAAPGSSRNSIASSIDPRSSSALPRSACCRIAATLGTYWPRVSPSPRCLILILPSSLATLSLRLPLACLRYLGPSADPPAHPPCLPIHIATVRTLPPQRPAWPPWEAQEPAMGAVPQNTHRLSHYLVLRSLNSRLLPKTRNPIKCSSPSSMI